jgi:hypothetical protein
MARNPFITIKSFEKETGIHFTLNHTGKMAGMQSLSSSCICNPACIARMKDENSICYYCFSAAMHNRYSALAACLEKNSSVLSSRLFELFELPMINAAFFRFESFGDLGSVTQARNYIRIAKRNPWTRFALWTKNPGYLAAAIREEGKPENLNVILSSPYMNTPCDASRWPFVDKIFTVYDKDHQANVNINCGYRKCLDCLLCYTKNDVTVINESLK